MAETIRLRHKVSGRIEENGTVELRDGYFSDVFEEVGPDAKPYLPEMHRVNLPPNPTPDQIKVAEAVGLIPETAAELKATVAAERAKADEPKKIGKD